MAEQNPLFALGESGVEVIEVEGFESFAAPQQRMAQFTAQAAGEQA